MPYEPITIPFRITVRGGNLRPDLTATAVGLAQEFREQGIPLKLRVGDGLFETFVRNSGKCFCHAEMGAQKDALHALEQLEPRKDPDSPLRLWGVVQDRFDLVRAMCDTDAILVFPLDDSQRGEVAFMLTELGRRPDSTPVVLVGWSNGELSVLKRTLPRSSGLLFKHCTPQQVGGALPFLRESRAFLARTATVEEAA